MLQYSCIYKYKWHSGSTPRYMPQRTENKHSNRYLYTYVHSSTVHSSQRVEAAQVLLVEPWDAEPGDAGAGCSAPFSVRDLSISGFGVHMGPGLVNGTIPSYCSVRETVWRRVYLILRFFCFWGVVRLGARIDWRWYFVAQCLNNNRNETNSYSSLSRLTVCSFQIIFLKYVIKILRYIFF